MSSVGPLPGLVKILPCLDDEPSRGRPRKHRTSHTIPTYPAYLNIQVGRGQRIGAGQAWGPLRAAHNERCPALGRRYCVEPLPRAAGPSRGHTHRTIDYSSHHMAGIKLQVPQNRRPRSQHPAEPSRQQPRRGSRQKTLFVEIPELYG